MNVKDKPRLGRGLDALFNSTGGTGEQAGVATNVVPINRISQNPFQPRKEFDADDLSSLCESIKALGVLQPLVVRQVGDQFQLVAGERRLRAAQSAGFTEVPVRVVDFNDQLTHEAALVENIQRADLNPIEKALGFKDYLERFGMTQEQLAERMGLDRTTISNLVGLLDLPAEVQEAVRLKQITMGHAKLLKGVHDAARQISLVKEIIARGHSVHATEALIKQPQKSETPAAAPKPAAEKTNHVQSIQDELRATLGTRVEIRLRDKDKGHFVLFFENNDDFQRLLEVLRRSSN